MSSGDLPINAESVVGFAMWHLSRGDTIDDVRTRIDADPRYVDIDPTVIDQSINRALRNVVARTAANAADENAPIGLAIFGTANRALVAGVRVLIEMRMPQGHTENMSVVINVHGNLTRKQIIDRIKAMADAGQIAFQSGRAYRGTAADVSIGAVFMGGYQNEMFTF